jgi:hypothetical protein
MLTIESSVDPSNVPTVVSTQNRGRATLTPTSFQSDATSEMPLDIPSSVFTTMESFVDLSDMPTLVTAQGRDIVLLIPAQPNSEYPSEMPSDVPTYLQ